MPGRPHALLYVKLLEVIFYSNISCFFSIFIDASYYNMFFQQSNDLSVTYIHIHMIKTSDASDGQKVVLT